MLYQSKNNMLITQKPGQGDRPTDYTRNCKQQYVKLQIATLQVSTMRIICGNSRMLSPPNVNICCVQETHWKGESA